jgi:hypothetical protein
MSISTSTKKRVRAYFLENSNLTMREIAYNLKLDPSTIGFALDSIDFHIVSSLNESNIYFLFNDFQEKKVITDPYKNIQNGFEFNQKEKVFLKGWGFKF